MTCRRGDVILVRYPDSNLRTYKKRPALVVQADGLNTGLRQRIVALITSNMNRRGPTRVAVRRNTALGCNMGLLTDSVVVTDNLATVLEREIDQVIGDCTSMPCVEGALRKTLAL